MSVWSSQFSVQRSGFFNSELRTLNSEPKNGFTLIELLVVLGIISVLAVVAVSSLPSFGTEKHQLKKEARELSELFKTARTAAVARRVGVDIYVNPAARTVYAVDAVYARELRFADAFFFTGGGVDSFETDTNRFFRTLSFPEETVIESFALSQIETEIPDNEIAPTAREISSKELAEENGLPVFSFTHIGSATGGGVTLFRGDARMDIACALLTGWPEVVTRKAER